MPVWFRSAGFFVILIVAGSVFAPAAVATVVFTVNTIDDGVDAVPGNGICSTTLAPPYICTLRAAVMEANRTPNAGATIMLPAGVYKLMISPHDADGEDNGDLTLATPSGYTPGPTAIVGAGAATTVIDANQIDRVLTVAAGRIATISGVTLRNGFTLYDGGGIYVAGQLTLSHSTIQNSQSSGRGGAIFNTPGALSLDHVNFIGNKATSDGGAVCNDTGTLTVTSSVFSGNSSPGAFGGAIASTTANGAIAYSTFSGNSAFIGGAIYTSSGTFEVNRSTIAYNNASYGGGIREYNGTLIVTESTISSNNSDVDGGGIYNIGTTHIYNSTIVFNQAAADNSSGGSGGGIYNTAGSFLVELHNSVIAGNYLSGSPIYDDCTGEMYAIGHEKFWTLDGCTVIFGPLTASATLIDSLGEFGPLQDNGGPTQTHALVPPSSMIDGAEPTNGCSGYYGLLTTDQRDAPRIAGVRCDVGAFEYGSKPDWIFADGFD